MRAALPTWSGSSAEVGRALESIDSWFRCDGLARIVAAFGGETPGGSTAEIADYLEAFSGTHWDFRRGLERNLAVAALFSEEQRRVTTGGLESLGMVPSLPSARHYDVVLMTGGMVRAGVVKPRFLRELVDSGISVGEGLFLGGFRGFGGDEAGTALALGIRGSNEFDAMVAGMESSFGPLGEPSRSGAGEPGEYSSWLELAWEPPWGPRLSVLAAPSSEPAARRANTVDTYRFWAEHRRRPEQRSVLIVTTPIYVPYQAAGAVEVLGVDYGMSVETVGVSARSSDLGALSQPFETQHQLQELRSGIRGMCALRRRLLQLERSRT